MRQPPIIQREIPLVKIVIVGNPKVGKSALRKKWVFNIFNPTYKETIGIDFNLKTLDVSRNIFKLQLYDVAGNTLQDGKLNKVYFTQAKIFFIVISTKNIPEERLAQINNWREKINASVNDDEKYKIVVVENKFDDGNLLTPLEIKEGIKEGENYVALSVKGNDHLENLDKTLAKMLPHLISQTPNFPPLAGIIKLNEQQADRILNFVERMIKRGTTHDTKKPYEVGLFGIGGKTYKYPSDETVTMPENVVGLLNSIDSKKAKVNPKELLGDIYEQSLHIAKAEEPVTRRESTQDFYSTVLPQYIFKSVQPEAMKIHADIDKLSNDRAKQILIDVKKRLLDGLTSNSNNPYEVSFFGGDTYKHERRKIKLPHHVALLITKIDAYMKTNNIANARQELSEIYQDIIQAQVTLSNHRSDRTQDFYDKVLPGVITGLINQIPLQLEAVAAPTFLST